MNGEKDLRSLVQGRQGGNISELDMRLTAALNRAGYSYVRKNEAWLRDGGIKAQEYIDTTEGKRLRGADLVRLSRGDAKVVLSLDNSDPIKFKITSAFGKETFEHIDRSIVLRMKELADKHIEDVLSHTLSLFR